jgi:hypothetical protein
VCPSAPHGDFSEVLTFCGTDESNAISVLPDDVLLEIFDLCRKNHYNHARCCPVWKWHLLLHVCKRWRQIIFESPYRLNLQIFCTYGTPVRENLGIWPAFPIVLELNSLRCLLPNDEDNAIAALEKSARVYSVRLFLTGSQLAKMVPVMPRPFPLLSCLNIHSTGDSAPVLPGGFLGRSAPRLQDVRLHGTPFPALPTLLLSTSNLINLTLSAIPPTGYISPEAIVSCLAVSPRLKSFTIEFGLYAPYPDQIRLPPATRKVLPALTSFCFKGVYEYLEDLVVQIDGPQLNQISIVYLNHPDDFQELSEFIDRSVGPELTPRRRARVSFHFDRFIFTLYRRANYPGKDRLPVKITITSEVYFWNLPDLAQVLIKFSAILYTIVHLKLNAHIEDDCVLEEAHDVEWVQLFREFPAMQILDVSGQLAVFIATALERITTAMVIQIFPSLDLIFIEDQPASSVQTIVAACQLSGRPVTFVETRAEFKKVLRSYTTVWE